MTSMNLLLHMSPIAALVLVPAILIGESNVLAEVRAKAQLDSCELTLHEEEVPDKLSSQYILGHFRQCTHWQSVCCGVKASRSIECTLCEEKRDVFQHTMEWKHIFVGHLVRE